MHGTAGNQAQFATSRRGIRELTITRAMQGSQSACRTGLATVGMYLKKADWRAGGYVSRLHMSTFAVHAAVVASVGQQWSRLPAGA